MQKVYLLLRNNQQQGPFDLQELLQLPVKETDLIWVEGKSAAWSYPTEIWELKAYFAVTKNEEADVHSSSKEATGNDPSPTPQTNKHKHIFVSLPHHTDPPKEPKLPTLEEALEAKADALRQKVQTYQTTHPVKEPEMVHTNLKRSIDDVAVDYADWTLRTQSKKKPLVTVRSVLLGVFITATLVSAWVLFSPQTEENKMPSTDPITVEKNPVNNDRSNMLPTADHSVVSTEEPAQENEPKKEVKKITPKVLPKKTDTLIAATTQEDSQVVQQPVVETSEPAVEQGVTEEPTVVEEKKKRSFGEALDGFFGKLKNKKGEENKEPATTGGERKSTKREETTEEPVLVDVSQQLKISSNKPTDNWMLGVKGMKLTLQNSSGMVVKNAVVEVQYFDEEDSLLDKKVIQFKNIKPNQKSTQPVPDHRLANHTAHKIVSATGIADGSN